MSRGLVSCLSSRALIFSWSRVTSTRSRMVSSSSMSKGCSRLPRSSNWVIISRKFNSSRKGSRRSLRSLNWIIWLLPETFTSDEMSLFVELLSVCDLWTSILVWSFILTRFAVVANEGQRIDIPDGCILENRLLSGNLNMIVRSHDPRFRLDRVLTLHFQELWSILLFCVLSFGLLNHGLNWRFKHIVFGEICLSRFIPLHFMLLYVARYAWNIWRRSGSYCSCFSLKIERNTNQCCRCFFSVRLPTKDIFHTKTSY